MVERKGRQTRDEKLENLIMNHSMIFMGVFEEAFSTIADQMTDVLKEGTAAIADAVVQAVSSNPPSGRKAAGNAKKLGGEIPLEVRTEVRNLISGIREETASQWPKNARLFKKYLSGPAFDKGIEIVERYDFGRPRLTEKLGDEVLASYVFLLKSGDKELAKMFKELADWQSGLPRPPWAP